VKEFFRKRFPLEVKRVVVYSSSPQKKILGWFNLDQIETLKPQEAWNTYGVVGSIAKKDFFEYYENKEIATAIKVKDVKTCSESVPDTKTLGITPPQSYSYVD